MLYDDHPNYVLSGARRTNTLPAISVSGRLLAFVYNIRFVTIIAIIEMAATENGNPSSKLNVRVDDTRSPTVAQCRVQQYLYYILPAFYCRTVNDAFNCLLALISLRTLAIAGNRSGYTGLNNKRLTIYDSSFFINSFHG